MSAINVKNGMCRWEEMKKTNFGVTICGSDRGVAVFVDMQPGS